MPALWREKTVEVWSEILYVIPEPYNPAVDFFPHVHFVLTPPRYARSLLVLSGHYIAYSAPKLWDASSEHSRKCTYTVQVNLWIFPHFSFFTTLQNRSAAPKFSFCTLLYIQIISVHLSHFQHQVWNYFTEWVFFLDEAHKSKEKVEMVTRSRNTNSDLEAPSKHPILQNTHTITTSAQTSRTGTGNTSIFW